MKILVLGKNGMLGHVVYNHFCEQGYEVIGTATKNGEILYDAYKNLEDLENIVKVNKPNVVINCIGILNQVAENNKALAVKLNSFFPHYVDELSKKYNFKFIHVSTDCVFDGKKGNYDEFSYPDATSFYGRSKALGEVINEKSVTLRTSIIGPDNNPNGIGLFQWFMRQKENTGGYSKVIWTGVTTIELAKCMEVTINNNLVGLHNVVNNETISKYDLLKLFQQVFYKNINITENANVESAKTLIRTSQSFDFNIPSYEKMIQEMAIWVMNHTKNYPEILSECNLEEKYESNDYRRY